MSDDFESFPPDSPEPWANTVDPLSCPDWYDYQSKKVRCCGCGRETELTTMDYAGHTWTCHQPGWHEYFGNGHPAQENRWPILLCPKCYLEWIPLPTPLSPPMKPLSELTRKYLSQHQ